MDSSSRQTVHPTLEIILGQTSLPINELSASDWTAIADSLTTTVSSNLKYYPGFKPLIEHFSPREKLGPKTMVHEAIDTEDTERILRTRCWHVLERRQHLMVHDQESGVSSDKMVRVAETVNFFLSDSGEWLLVTKKQEAHIAPNEEWLCVIVELSVETISGTRLGESLMEPAYPTQAAPLLGERLLVQFQSLSNTAVRKSQARHSTILEQNGWLKDLTSKFGGKLGLEK